MKGELVNLLSLDGKEGREIDLSRRPDEFCSRKEKQQQRPSACVMIWSAYHAVDAAQGRETRVESRSEGSNSGWREELLDDENGSRNRSMT